MFAAFALAGCSDGDWPGPVPIDPESWEIEIDLCGHPDGIAIAFAEGRVINTTAERSPFYDIRYTVTYTDGTQVVGEQANEVVAPVDAGEASPFSFSLRESQGRTVSSCELIVTDAVSNYTD